MKSRKELVPPEVKVTEDGVSGRYWDESAMTVVFVKGVVAEVVFDA